VTVCVGLEGRCAGFTGCIEFRIAELLTESAAKRWIMNVSTSAPSVRATLLTLGPVPSLRIEIRRRASLGRHASPVDLDRNFVRVPAVK
jgi:hypothetical protein